MSEVLVDLYTNGKIWPGARPGAGIERHEALAVSEGRVLAIGSRRELRSRFSGREIDLRGCTVVPGLIDGHSHAIRGGSTWLLELHWEHISSPHEALASIRTAAAAALPGTWISSIGGWHASQFPGGWMPTREQLDEAAPNNPVYVQSLYETGVCNTPAMNAVGLRAAADRLPSGAIVLDAASRPTGTVAGLPAFTLFAQAMGVPGLQQQMDGLRTAFAEFNRLGLTGLTDPGGFGMPAGRYDAVGMLASAGELDIRIRAFRSAVDPGSELDQIAEIVRAATIEAGDEWLKVIGIGEVVHFGCHDFEGLEDLSTSDGDVEELFAISSLVAAAGLPMHMHAVTNEVASLILDCWDRVNVTVPIGALRFSLAHGDRLSKTNIARMRALGVGLVVDARQAFRAAASRAAWGEQAMASVPPLGDLNDAGVIIGVGTDATRASSYNPWLCLWWLIDGRSLDGLSRRSADHRFGREAALTAMTSGNAWFSREEGSRGRLDPGYRADFAVLSDDFFSMDIDEIPSLTSELTVVDQRQVYSSGFIVEPT